MIQNGTQIKSGIKIHDDSVSTCDKIIEETKTVTTNFNKKMQSVKKKKILYFICLFINYRCIIDSC